MTRYATPGVYYERIDASPPGVMALRTDVAGFVGIARRGPIDTAVPVQSWRQFQAYFGDFTGAGFLAYAIRAFFDNGGRKCWVIRVASPAADSASFDLRAQASLASGAAAALSPAGGVWRVAASSPGVWGDALDVALRQTHLAQTNRDDSATSTPQYMVVKSVAGFSRGTLVRITQDGTQPVCKVVSDVDATYGLLYWVCPNPRRRLPYDAPLTGFTSAAPVVVESVEYTLLIRESGQLVRVYEGLSLVPEHRNYGPAVLAPLVIDPEQSVTSVLPAAPEPVILLELRKVAMLPVSGFSLLDVSVTAPTPLSGGADGLAALSVDDFIGQASDPLASDIVRAQNQRGLRVLEEVDEVAMLAVPDIQIRPIPPPERMPGTPCVPDPCLPGPAPSAPVPAAPAGDLPPVFSDQVIYQVQAAMIDQCERLGDRIALLDPPYSAVGNPALGAAAAQAWRMRFESKYAAFYYPWMRIVDPVALGGGPLVGSAITRDIPPCGHIAGQYADTDLTVGVFKAPANAPLVWAQDVTAAVDDALHGVLNPAGINAIRALPGRGIRIFGARTVSSDPDWRFVNVRRLMMMIEKAIYASIQWAVFEPNDERTWSKLRLVLTSFLLALWEQGALAGASPAAAFFVRCDITNNPASARDQGQLLAEVGVAPAQPFEFVVLRVGRVDNEFQMTEVDSR